MRPISFIRQSHMPWACPSHGTRSMRHGLRTAIAIAIAVLSPRNAEAQMTPQFALGLQGGGEYPRSVEQH